MISPRKQPLGRNLPERDTTVQNCLFTLIFLYHTSQQRHEEEDNSNSNQSEEDDSFDLRRGSSNFGGFSKLLSLGSSA